MGQYLLSAFADEYADSFPEQLDALDRFGIPLPPDLQKKISGMSFRETAVYFKETF